MGRCPRFTVRHRHWGQRPASVQTESPPAMRRAKQVPVAASRPQSAGTGFCRVRDPYSPGPNLPYRPPNCRRKREIREILQICEILRFLRQVNGLRRSCDSSLSHLPSESARRRHGAPRCALGDCHPSGPSASTEARPTASGWVAVPDSLRVIGIGDSDLLRCRRNPLRRCGWCVRPPASRRRGTTAGPWGGSPRMAVSRTAAPTTAGRGRGRALRP